MTTNLPDTVTRCVKYIEKQAKRLMKWIAHGINMIMANYRVFILQKVV